MADKDLKQTEHFLKNQNAWWYEDSYGIDVYINDIKGHPQLHATRLHAKICWSSLRAALKRKDK